jgi:phage terminase large subunit-like protein
VTSLIVPALERKPWPSLGGEVCDWIEANLVFGPGDLRGQPARLDDEKRALIYRAYEVYPKDHEKAGRRRFKRVAISLRKGTAKTEMAAWIAGVELHPQGPVRCTGWRKVGKAWEPVGGPVTDPYIPMVAYTEEQSEDLAYGALYAILSESPVSRDFDIGLERIMRVDGKGKAVALASAPDARDGARTTFQHFDETHRFTLPRLREAHRTMLANIPKRVIADAWSLETTTAYSPGESSVAESTFDYARKVDSGDIPDSRLFFFHRSASDKHDISTPTGLRAAVIEASGPAASWSDIDGIVEQFREPDASRPFLERVWLNRIVRSSEHAFDAERWKKLVDRQHEVPDGALVTLGFDGSRFDDATALVATEVESGFVWALGIWQRPPHRDRWEVPVEDVNVAVADAFERYDVWRMYADPAKWESTLASWAGDYGKERVIGWWTNRPRDMSRAVRAFAIAILTDALSHSGDPRLSEHVGNAHRRHHNLRDDDGERVWDIVKERPDSPHKIDAAMAAVLSWEARLDAIRSGVLHTDDEESVWETRTSLYA